MTCERVSKFLETHDITVSETVPASRKLGPDEAKSIAKAARRIVVAKGKKTDEFKFSPSDSKRDAVVPLMLGPTGNLRSPCIRMGQTVLVGFNEDVFREVFGV